MRFGIFIYLAALYWAGLRAAEEKDIPQDRWHADTADGDESTPQLSKEIERTTGLWLDTFFPDLKGLSDQSAFDG